MTNLIEGLPGTFTEEEVGNLAYRSTVKESWKVTSIVTRRTRTITGAMPATGVCQACGARFGTEIQFNDHVWYAHENH